MEKGIPLISAVTVIVIFPGPVGVMFVLKSPPGPVKTASGETEAEPEVTARDTGIPSTPTPFIVTNPLPTAATLHVAKAAPNPTATSKGGYWHAGGSGLQLVQLSFRIQTFTISFSVIFQITWTVPIPPGPGRVP